jgi:hypothetical protein
VIVTVPLVAVICTVGDKNTVWAMANAATMHPANKAVRNPREEKHINEIMAPS